jgi:hypothetical protein
MAVYTMSFFQGLGWIQPWGGGGGGKQANNSLLDVASLELISACPREAIRERERDFVLLYYHMP